MKTKQMTLICAALFGAVTWVSCKGDSIETPSEEGSAYFMRWKVGTTQYALTSASIDSNTSFFALFQNGQLSVASGRDPWEVGFAVANPSTGRSYVLNARATQGNNGLWSDGHYSWITNSQNVGTVSITSFDQTKVVGTFSFIGKNSIPDSLLPPGVASVVNITSGEFCMPLTVR